MLVKVINIAILVTLFSLSESQIHVQTKVYENANNPFDGEVDLRPFVKIGVKYYFIGETKLNWYGAQNDCAQRGSKGASIESEAEMRALNTYLGSRNYADDIQFWLSGTDLEHQGEFKWISTGQKLSYARWTPGQPDNFRGNQHCVLTWYKSGRYEMDDENCANLYYYICEANSLTSVLVNFW